MKKLFLFILIFCFCKVAKPQFPLSQSLGSPSTQVYSKGGLGVDSAVVFRVNYTDTIEANRGFIDGIPGAVIRAGGSLWIRNQAATAWSEIGSGGGAITALTNGLTLSGSTGKLGGTLTENTLVNGANTYRMDFDGVIRFRAEANNGAGNTGLLYLDTDSVQINGRIAQHFRINAAEKMLITSTGVGIGVTPTAAFHQAGTAKFDLGSDATGDMFYRNSSGFFTRLPIGTSSQFLIGGTIPAWSSTLPTGAVKINPGITKIVDTLTPETRWFTSKYSGLYEQGEQSPYQNSFLVKQLNGGLWPTYRDGISIINANDDTLMTVGGWNSTSTDSAFYSINGGATWTFLWLAPWGADHSIPTFKADDDYWYHIGGDYQGTSAQKLSVWRTRTPLVRASWVQMTNAATVSSRILHDAIGFNNALYWYGGQYTVNYSEGTTDTVWKSIDGGATWAYHATAPNGVFDKNISKTSVIRGGRVYFIAGGRYDAGTPANATYNATVYSTADFTTFRTENSIPGAGVQYPAVFAINGYIGSFGGYNGSANTNALYLMDRDGQWHIAANYDSARTVIPITHAVGVTNFKDRILFISGSDFNYSYSYYKTRYITTDSLVNLNTSIWNERTTIGQSAVGLVSMLSNNLIFDKTTEELYRFSNASNGNYIQLDGTNNEIRFGLGVGPTAYTRVGITTGQVGEFNSAGEFIISTTPAYDVGAYKLQVDGSGTATVFNAGSYQIDESQVLDVAGLVINLGAAGGFSTVTGTGIYQFGAVTGAPSLRRVNSTDLWLADANGTDLTSRFGIGTAPTARLHILEGTATAGFAPLKFNAGVNLGTPEAGAVEWNGTNLFITQTTGPTRKTIAYTTDIPTTLAISSLTAATGTNTINNAAFEQAWSWNSLAGANGLALSANTTAAASDNQVLFSASLSGVNATSTQTTRTANFANTHSGTGSTNIAARFFAGSGDNNYAIIVPSGGGNVGIGTSTPTSLAHINGALQLGTATSTLGQLLMSGNTSGTITIKSQAAAGTYNFNLPTTAGTSGHLLTSGGGGATAMTYTDPAVLVASYVGTGTYTPTLTNTANLDASTSHVFQYSWVTDPTSGVQVVTVSGYVDVDPTTTLTDTQLTISVPIASTFGNVQECGGTGAATLIASESGGIRAVASSGNVMLQWKCVDVTSHSMYLSFTYKVTPP